MKKEFLTFLSTLSCIFLLTGCVSNTTPQSPRQAFDEHNATPSELTEKILVVYGEGVAPLHTISPAQAMALAKRAAIADGYRQLGEKLYGTKLSATETIKDAALKDSRIISQVNGLIKDASITDGSFKDGLYSVRMELSMSGRRWQELFAY